MRANNDLEIVTYNVRGLGDFSKRKDIFHFLRNEKSDIICLQELHVTKEKENMFRNQWGGRAWFSSRNGSSGGVGILLQNKAACNCIDVINDKDGSIIIITLDLNGLKLKVINIYGPPHKDDPAFFAEVFSLAKPEEDEYVIFCGDWNITLNQAQDTYNYSGRDRKPGARELVKEMSNKLNLHDVWRIFNGEKKQYSWRKNNPVKCARLDFFLVSEEIVNKTVSCEMLPAYRSDHSRVALRLNLYDERRGRGFWKFNCSLLKDSDYLQLVKEVIQDIISSYACPVYSELYMTTLESRENIQMVISDVLFLEVLLLKIRSNTISYSIRKKKQNTERQKSILSEIDILEALPNPSRDELDDIAKKQLELQTMRASENEGRIIRSRARWYEEGEKSSGYFLKLEKRNYAGNLMPCLNIGNRQLSSSEDILSALCDHYETLFKQDNINEYELANYLEKINCPKLSKSESEYVEQEITIDELGVTLQKLSNNKSPGSDGFPYEFFKVFWRYIKHFVHRSLISGLNNGELSITQREGLITLVPKPLKPRNLISSWRPITLLNSTYKILSATIANRLKKVLDSVIHPDQTAFLKNRFIGENTRLIYDVLWETYAKKRQGMMLSVDFKSAFDVMSWTFIESCLRKFNFGTKFIHIFWSLHKQTFSRIIYNGHPSKNSIRLERGCRQGDPVSCYFFIIGAEILANKIRQNKKIKGIFIKNKPVKVIQYADDTTFFLDGSSQSLREVFNELGWFAKFSGLAPNVSKSNAMWIGSKALQTDIICPDIELNWVTKVRLLGVVFNPKCLEVVEENVRLKKEAILKTIRVWQNRNLTLVGRIVIVKSLLLSQITHILATLPTPSQETIKELNKILFTFVWGSKRNPVGRKRLCQSVRDNGLGMIDIDSFIKSLKIRWVKRLIIGLNSTWRSIIPNRLQLNFIWNYGVKALKKEMLKISNPFWKDVISAWMSFSTLLRTTDEDLCNENVFNSDVTKFKQIVYHTWERHGVKFIGDLLENGKLIDFHRFKEKYNISCIRFEYDSLLHSLPKSLKQDRICGLYLQPALPARMQFLLNNKSFSALWSNLSRNDCVEPQRDIQRIENKWIRDIGVFNPLSVLMVKRSIHASRYVTFQYKLVMRILTTNTFLCLINIQDSDRCSFCEMVPETLEHLFLTCAFVKKLWNDINQYVLQNGMEHMSTGVKIFGDKESEMITHIVTVAKFVIYDARRRKSRPTFAHFKIWLKRDFVSEKYIANKNEKMESFFNKWGALQGDLFL